MTNENNRIPLGSPFRDFFATPLAFLLPSAPLFDNAGCKRRLRIQPINTLNNLLKRNYVLDKCTVYLQQYCIWKMSTLCPSALHLQKLSMLVHFARYFIPHINAIDPPITIFWSYFHTCLSEFKLFSGYRKTERYSSRIVRNF